jgi:hypothetical protein
MIVILLPDVTTLLRTAMIITLVPLTPVATSLAVSTTKSVVMITMPVRMILVILLWVVYTLLFPVVMITNVLKNIAIRLLDVSTLQ